MEYQCPACDASFKFGIQRCVCCGTFIFWKQDRTPEVRTQPLTWPQKAELIRNVQVFPYPEVSDTVVKTMEPQRVVIVNSIGEYYQLEEGGFAHWASVNLWGHLPQVNIVDSTGINTLINVLDTPQWPDGSIVSQVKQGDIVQVYQFIPGWVRIGKNQWISTFWIDPKDQKKVENLLK